MATNCWQSTVTIYYTVGPSVVTLQQSEADAIMNEVLTNAKRKLTCAGLSLALALTKATITMPANRYAISGTFGVFYGNMDSTKKQRAFTCLGLAQIFHDVILSPEMYTSPIASIYWADRATQSNYQVTTCCTGGMISVNIRTFTP
ncbi:hypothetical protein QZH41_017748 [Actinostola sp. cb2023]|nr:hypothetical protein QZH41_017748 [Actinostola sp. cb2023]